MSAVAGCQNVVVLYKGLVLPDFSQISICFFWTC